MLLRIGISRVLAKEPQVGCLACIPCQRILIFLNSGIRRALHFAVCTIPSLCHEVDLKINARPETVESLFIAFRLTGDDHYRREGWRIFQSIEKHCKVESGGYAAIINVDSVPAEKEDKMETFLMV